MRQTRANPCTAAHFGFGPSLPLFRCLHAPMVKCDVHGRSEAAAERSGGGAGSAAADVHSCKFQHGGPLQCVPRDRWQEAFGKPTRFHSLFLGKRTLVLVGIPVGVDKLICCNWPYLSQQQSSRSHGLWTAILLQIAPSGLRTLLRASRAAGAQDTG